MHHGVDRMHHGVDYANCYIKLYDQHVFPFMDKSFYIMIYVNGA